MAIVRKILFLMGVFSFLSGAFGGEPTKTNRELEDLEAMFAEIRAQPNWKADSELLWGYFFTDPDPTKLEPLAKQLASDGYRVVAIYPTDDGSTHFLHVERIEHHTPKTLHARNQEFEALAAKFHVQSYDGMDVGPVLPSSD